MATPTQSAPAAPELTILNRVASIPLVNDSLSAVHASLLSNPLARSKAFVLPSVQLTSGQYYIRNEEAIAGRNLREDKSLLPKRVFCPTDVPEAQLWEIEALPNGRYKLLTRGAATGELNGLLYASLGDEESGEEWIITRRNGDDPRGQYTIEKADGSAGWVAQTYLAEPQIAVRPLLVGPSEPPFFPPNQLWSFQRD